MEIRWFYIDKLNMAVLHYWDTDINRWLELPVTYVNDENDNAFDTRLEDLW